MPQCNKHPDRRREQRDASVLLFLSLSGHRAVVRRRPVSETAAEKDQVPSFLDKAIAWQVKQLHYMYFICLPGVAF